MKRTSKLDRMHLDRKNRPHLFWYTIVCCIVMLILVWIGVFVWAMKTPTEEEPAAAGLGKVAHTSFPRAAASKEPKVWAELYEGKGCTGKKLVVKSSHSSSYCDGCQDMCRASFEDGSPAHQKVTSMRVFVEGAWPAKALVNLGKMCAADYSYPDAELFYKGITPKDGCVTPEELNPITYIEFEGLEHVFALGDVPSYNIAYSCESSSYFGYQVYSNLYGFKQSNQPHGTGYTRLLTSNTGPDDLTHLVTTFTAKRDPYSYRYSPINKPDAVAQWLNSAEAPKEEVIVLIDPDNWLTPGTSLANVVAEVKKGHAVAQPAFYQGNPLLQEFFDTYICESNCGFPVATVGIPYFIHREDLKAMAPLWKNYTIKTKEIFDRDPAIRKKYNSLQPGWCAEMHGYNFAAAELGIAHTAKGGLQIRDVDGRLPLKKAQKIPMIHMGRAWVPNRSDFQPLKEYWHTEGYDFHAFGAQVWCKCNNTASQIVPWPVPEGTDFASNITLTYLHNSMQEYGPLVPSDFRKTVGKHGSGYHDSMP